MNKLKKIQYIKILKEILEDYYLFIPTAILNEAVSFPEYKDKSKKMYGMIRKIKKIIKELENVTRRKI